MPLLRALAAFSAALTVAGTAFASDGGSGSCASSGECGPPTPYCHPTALTCVECLSNRNCSGGRVCDTNLGECRGCLSDADCAPGTPFCDGAGSCVECLNDAQCGNQGIACLAGECGRCGDGVCSSKEAFYWESDGVLPPPRVYCPADCGTLCPTKDIGSELGTFSIDGANLRNVFADTCGRFVDGAEGIFGWHAPRSGTFRFTAEGAALSVMIGDCDSLGFGGGGCSMIQPNDAGERIGQIDMPMGPSDGAVIVVETGAQSAASVSLTVACAPDGCTSAEGGAAPGTAACVENSRKRGEPICAGVECACEHCAQDYEHCGAVPGCRQIDACMRNNGCVAAECNDDAKCKRVIDAFGGLSSPAFDTAARVLSCELTFACALPCGGEAGATDAGTHDSGSDAASACSAGDEIACSCEGGSGMKTCSDAGQFGPCRCAAPARAPESSNCGCRLGTREPLPGRGTSLGAIATLVACLAACRRKPSKRF